MTSHSHVRAMCNGNSVSSAFSALHLLRSYSLFGPTADICRYEPYSTRECNFSDSDILSNSTDYSIDAGHSTLTPSLSAAFALPGTLIQPPLLASMPPLMQTLNMPQPFSNNTSGTVLTRQFAGANGISSIHRRVRSEKKPIPDEQKDEKYYERRKRNNQAAKKSRDARKIREDHIALRATMLEHENAVLRAQVLTLRDEAQSLRHMLIKQQPVSLQAIERSISTMTPVTLSPSHSSTTLDCQV